MSCQSLAARAFAEPDKDMTHCSSFHRSVRFSSDSRSSTRASNDPENKRETPGSISLTALSVTPMTSQGSAMSQSAPSASATYDVDDTPVPPVPSCRFPKLEECAHFHYERVSLGGLSIETVRSEDKCQDSMEEGWICLKVRSHVNSSCEESAEGRALSSSWTEASDVREWTLTRNRDNLLQLDDMLHRCIYDRKVSGLPNLREKISPALARSESEYQRLISDYVHHLSIIADDSINCGPVLNWLQMDNKGHKLLVANEDSSSINTPAVAAAYSVRKYVSQARDEISFEVGDMISIIDMPGPAESLWWRGKRGFRVGFFPHHCVAVIGDKVPRHMTQPPPIVGSVAVAPIKPVLRKHGKLISLFRSFILSRPSRRSLKQQGILRERVFGCDLGEHLLNCGHEVPLVLVECAAAIEARGAVDGVYRLSGGAGLTQRLRAAFDAGAAPDLSAPATLRDPHAVPSLLKMYFRELPNPLCTYQLYESFVSAVQAGDEAARLRAVRDTVVKLPPPHYRTLAYLMRHLRRVSLLGEQTGMTARNMAIVWAPNLLRAPRPQHALQGVAVQAVVTEFLICYAEELFAQEQGEDSGPESLEQERCESQIELRGNESCRRPKSLPINPPTKLLSLEEARRRGQVGGGPQAPSPRLPPASGAIAAAAAANTQLRPSSHLRPKYIEVGSGPNNLPQYHTVLDLPAPGKRGVKRSVSGWRGLFSRTKQQRAPHLAAHHHTMPTPTPTPNMDIPMPQSGLGLRPVKSCESLTSDTDTLAPLADRAASTVPLKHHTRRRSSGDLWQHSAMLPVNVADHLSPNNVDIRSSSCDSYFEPWQAELADMRLRLSPQERDHHMFSEEDDTQLQLNHAQGDSLCSTPPESGLCSAEPSPRRNLRVDIHQANELAERRRLALEEQLSQIGYIDGESPRARPRPPPEKRHSARPASPRHTDIAKRLCKDRDSPMTSLTDFPTSLGNVKLRERNSPRKSKARYSGMHVDTDKQTNRLSWQGKDGHSTLIKIDWPAETSVSTLNTSTMTSTPLTPVTPVYDPLESDSEVSETNKHTIQITSEVCNNCDEEKCLKCELKATDYENLKDFAENLHDSLEHSPLHSTDVSYQNLNRLSAVSNSSNSDHTDKKRDDNDIMKVMTTSHESSSSYSNVSLKGDELYECYSYSRPNYINLQSSSTSKSSPGSPLKSPLKSTISITFRSPTKSKFEDTPTNDRDSVYEDIDLEKNLSIVEDASIPQTDASLPTQQACQPDDLQDLIILETPTKTDLDQDVDVYSQVKFFKKSIDEVNAMVIPEDRHYENIAFEKENDYENINVDTLKICDKDLITEVDNTKDAIENGNFKSMNVRELAIRFESPTEQKPPFTFDKFKAEIKYPSLERKEEKTVIEVKKIDFKTPTVSPKSYKLSKNSCNARSLDENAFIKEFGTDQSNVDRRKSLEVKMSNKKLPDLNLNTEHENKVIITPTTENKISLIQRFDRPDIKNLIPIDCEKELSRERIEKYKEERRNFLREKYSSQSFRSNPEQLTRIKIKKDRQEKIESCERLKDEPGKFERRNTVDLGQRLRFSLAKSSNNLESIPSPCSPEKEFRDDTSHYDRELPNPLCTYQLYESFVSAVQAGDEAARLRAVRDTVVKLPPPHYRTLAYLMRHLRRVSLLGEQTGMTARNMAIVWAPNLLRAPRPQHALQGVAVQAVVTEFLICYAEELFAQEQGEDSGPESLEQERCESQIELRGNESCRRPKSLPINPPTKLLSLEEARRRGQVGGGPQAPSPRLPPASGAIAAAAAANTQLRPSSHLRPKYIEVGSGPNNLPQYHTVLDLPAPGKRGVKRSVSGWRGLFSRTKQQRAPHLAAHHHTMPTPTPTPNMDIPMPQSGLGLRPVKSCESLTSDTDTLAPLADRAASTVPLKHHTRRRSSGDLWQHSAMLPVNVADHLSPNNVDIRSSSCDSYFEPWQAELADMRLRLSPQERDHHMFSEEDDTQLQLNHAQGDSLCSTPPESGLCSAEPSPRRNLRVDIHQANELAERRRLALEEQLSQIGYIDGESPRARPRPPPEKRHSARPASPRHTDIAKRLCKDRDSPMTSLTDFPTSLGNVKLRERNSPRKSKARYSGMHVDTDKQTNRLSWQGKDGHSTLIKIDWPAETSVSTLNTSTMTSTPLTPVTPVYDPLESDSEVSETNKHTIQITSEVCNNCDEEKCLKCELKATDYENLKDFAENLHDSLEHSPLHSTDVSYQNLNRLSAVSNSSNSDHTDKKRDDNDIMKVMTTSHESSSSYSNVSLKGDELYECYSYSRPNYINLQSSSTSKSSPGSPLKSPLKSTISITFRSPTKSKFEDTPTNDRDSVYEDIDLEKNLSIVEDASIPQTDASLPTQQACQPDDLQDLIILETPTKTDLDQDVDVYSQVKFFKKSIDEVNAMVIPEDRHYENIAFEKENDYENINVDTLKICDKDLITEVDNTKDAIENGNFKSMNVRELAIRFESPTEQKPPFTFDKFKAEIKYPSLERKEEKTVIEVKKIDFKTPTVSPKSYKLSKNSCNARSLDENAFIKEFGTDQSNVDRRKSLEVKMSNKKLPDLNLNTEHENKVIITPTTENKISLIQRFDRPDIKNLIPIDCEKELSRERIEKYKEERRNFLREKYSSQSFRSNPEQLTRIKIKKDRQDKIESCERLKDEPGKFERRNTVDLGQRLRFSLAKSSNNLESIPSPCSPEKEFRDDTSHYDRKEKVSPSYNIRDMTAIFEQKSHQHTG